MKSKGIPFVHAFTGCDVASTFCGKDKIMAWPTWDVYPEAPEVFAKLSMYPQFLGGTTKRRFLNDLSS